MCCRGEKIRKCLRGSGARPLTRGHREASEKGLIPRQELPVKTGGGHPVTPECKKGLGDEAVAAEVTEPARRGVPWPALGLFEHANDSDRFQQLNTVKINGPYPWERAWGRD